MITARGIVAIAVTAAAFAAACVAAGGVPLRQAMLSYLFAYMFCLGIALGSLGLLMVHVLSGGAWGVMLRAPLIAATRMVPWLALLLLPILAGAGVLYPWAQGGAHVADANLGRQRWYLDRAFFVVRAIVCFAVWQWLACRVRSSLRASTRPAGLAAAGLVLYAITILVGSTDWIMSLVPAHRSSAFGLLAGTSQMTAAAALAIPVAARGDSTAPVRIDLGNLLLTLVLAWSYLVFMGFLTAWIADLPAETIWYLPRTTTSWRWLSAALAVGGCAIPVAILLVRAAKRTGSWLAATAVLVLVAQCAFVFWLVVPDSRPNGFAPAWTDPLALIAVVGICAVPFLRSLKAEGAGQ